MLDGQRFRSHDMTRVFDRRSSVLLAVVVTTFVCAATILADWPRFRGPTGFGTSSDSRIPIEWSDTKNLKWKLELPGAGFSSPIVVKDRAFVTCFSGAASAIKRHLVAVDLRTGEISWSRTVASSGSEARVPSFGTDHGHASNTPVSDGERVYAFFGNAGVVAYDMKGAQVWKKSVGTSNASMFGSAASPILYKNLVIVHAGAESESIRALDKKTGEEVWKSEGDGLSRSYSVPVIARNSDGKDRLLVSVPGEIWTLNPANGKLRWYAETAIDLNACPSVVAQGNVVFVIGGRRGGRTAVRMGGRGDVTDTHVLWSTRGGAYVPSPVFYNDHLYWINDGGIATCVDTKTGDEVKKTRIGGKFYASLVLVGDKLYAVSRFGGTHVLKATPPFEKIALNTLSDKSDFSASPAVSNGRLILRSNEYLYCIAAD